MALSFKAEARAVLGNFVLKAISVPIEKVCRVALMIVAARVLGTTSFGTYQFATTLTGLLVLGADLGLSNWTIRALARAEAPPATIIETGLRMRAGAGLFYVLALALAAALLPPGEARVAMVFLGLGALANAFVDYFAAILRGRERFRDEAHLNIARALLITGAGLGALVRHPALAWLAAGLMAGSFVAAAWGFHGLRRRQRAPSPGAGPSFDGRLARKAVRQAGPIWLATLLSLLFFRGDIVMLQAFSGAAEVGAYGAAYKIFDAAMILPTVVMTAAFPALARAHGAPELRRRWELALAAVVFVAGALVGAAVYLSRERLVGRVFGPAFAGAIPSLRVLSLGMPLLFLNIALRLYLLARGLEGHNLLLSALLLVLNVGVNLILIPRLGGPGAAWGTLATEAGLTAGCLWAMRGSDAPPGMRA